MLWICRTGKNSMYHDMFLQNQKIYLPWELFNINLSAYKTYSDIKVIVPEEIKTNNLNSVANTSNQLDYFCNVMKIDDYVLIPNVKSRFYTLCKITGDYKYSVDDELHHSHSIKILVKDIPRSIFSKSIQFSLGAYRTIFKVKQEEEVFKTIEHFLNPDGGKVNG